MTQPPIESFEESLRGLVECQLPRLFAVMQVYRENENAWVAAWGLRFDDGRVEVTSVDGGRRLRLRSLRLAAVPFQRDPDISTRLIWADPDHEPTEPGETAEPALAG
ncbi:hypothetical protein [Streptomyces profundus]|uniref:hypothetical protein n=1 Tax=Streptomyces profundus TaxID=2867410 RepID=UPI001D15EDC1|nr:hypothetical protein [Streptomyces sp. MA3_2.13]UED85741.1 hypothetical protein K4G22_17350 [Streptomyces sp. MA3_2.13]